MLIRLLTILFFLIVTGTSQLNAQEAKEQPNKKLIIGVKQTPPFIIKEENGQYSGISIALWENIAKELRLDFEYKEYDLNGLLGALRQGEVDVCINPLTVTSQRVEQFDFTQPFFITNLAIAVDKSQQNKWLSFLSNFFSLAFLKAVLLLLLVLLSFGVLVWFFERGQNKEEFGPGMKGIWNGLWWSAVTMTTVGYGDKSPKTIGGRVVALIWMFTAIIIISGFTASIASSLTVNELEFAVKGPKDLKKVHTLAVRASSGQQYLENNNIGHEETDNLKMALQQLAGEKVNAVVYDEPIMKYTIKNLDLGSKVAVIPSKFATQYYSFSLPKNSELRGRINPVLLSEINGREWRVILGEYDLEK
ncbi:transporter substrate-binding domain-containing protein [Fulvivirga sp. 29W222]|uniref:Transporter substrate-binding domain-containing protein n=1 Tax=Fulvivirga marina TaxID=2494733 RepID=A0A937KGE6_9BACT|nr:transporter substrate-binding domain-containing protein [Fulvivirga marina]MBL6449118.1 transporter substrate-binding domain-containing protein [Fulvivirga marina]